MPISFPWEVKFGTIFLLYNKLSIHNNTGSVLNVMEATLRGTKPDLDDSRQSRTKAMQGEQNAMECKGEEN